MTHFNTSNIFQNVGKAHMAYSNKSEKHTWHIQHVGKSNFNSPFQTPSDTSLFQIERYEAYYMTTLWCVMTSCDVNEFF